MDRLKCCTLTRGNAGVTIAFESKFDKPVRVTVDASKSTNTRSHSGSLAAELVLQPGERVVAHNLQPLDTRNSYSYSWSTAWKVDA